MTKTSQDSSDLVHGFSFELGVRASEQERNSHLIRPGFGRIHTDHMVSISYDRQRGWDAGSLHPYRPIVLDPTAMVLHYGQAIFEGLKAYRQPNGTIAVFRPMENANRFNRSATRLSMPQLPNDLFIRSIRALLHVDRDWVPKNLGQSLYLRPLMFASEPMLGVRPSDQYEYILIASPADPFFSAEPTPLRVWITHEYVRAAPGGTGEAKCAGNYAASLLAQAEAFDAGCDQVVWLDAISRTQVEEMGGMNLFFVEQSGDQTRIVTPRLTGTLLAGITRLSILQLAADAGFQAAEIDLSVDEWRDRCASGTITEAFACGTAAVIAPIGEVRSSKSSWLVGDGGAGPITMRLRKSLLDIQHGISEDRHGWMEEM
ncbi:branched-chain amino acid aminotransferase [Acidithrix sp. C25]|uniref:branched-chain amino acid aminotransferase n=1 Tax=Acidithrix sp. C25 TaxID=1671482 RepID=UPI00191BC11D|nr:branched-chain amino acid aminotransferase [Acidithrix sp. C25]